MQNHLGTLLKVGRLLGQSLNEIYSGFGVRQSMTDGIREQAADKQFRKDLSDAGSLAQTAIQKRNAAGIMTDNDLCAWGIELVDQALIKATGQAPHGRFRNHLIGIVARIIRYEEWYLIPSLPDTTAQKSELWAWEDHLRRVIRFYDQHTQASDLFARYLAVLISPLIEANPGLLQSDNGPEAAISFDANVMRLLEDLPAHVESMLHVSFAPELEPLNLFQNLRGRLNHNLVVASGGITGKDIPARQIKLPSKNKTVAPHDMAGVYLTGTPLQQFLEFPVPITLPDTTRFEHMHIVAGSGHGKTQTLQHLILRDLEKVEKGDASIIVIDSQSDLINTIAGLQAFAPGEPLADRLVIIDPTDIEWPVALNLFDAGLERLDQYAPLDRERLTNSILELYDFVLGSLLDAGMTQKQNVIFRYITRLLLHIPGATIHTLREILEDGGSAKYQEHIDKLEGSARNFFETEFNGKEFVATKRQVVRRLYGILENQTFERMFTHPKSKLDLFAEMNAGKVILINTAKDLLKEQGAEIFGRFFIALIAQAAQERAVLPKSERLPTFVYVDEASDYFDRNIGIILSQARKYNVGMVLAHQFMGQLEPRLHDAISANTAIKFAGGVSAKDARALSNDLRTDANFITEQDKLHFAAFIKGQTKRAVSLSVAAGQMEKARRMSDADRAAVQDVMRQRYAVPHVLPGQKAKDIPDHTDQIEMPPDTGEPMPW